jgi:putative DNA primase/helicase
MIREPLRERMKGRWHGVLPMLGVPSAFLTGKHQPCPMCGGRDRARFDDKEGMGTFICSQCGAGDGVSLVMKVNGWDFKTAAERIEALAGDVTPRASKPAPDPDKLMRRMRDRWNSGKAISQLVKGYLFGRGIDPGDVCDLREDSASREMLALVRDASGNGCQVHRTLLSEDGAKLDRLFMPGPIAKGAAVRLMPHDGELGIAEGIETALSAAILFGLPTWAALNASLLKTWEPPADLKRVVVFADNDENCTGQAAAYELARRLSSRVAVSVELPKTMGQDWNDVLQERASLSQGVA